MSEAENPKPEDKHWLATFVGKIVNVQLAVPYIAGHDNAGKLVATDVLEGRLGVAAETGGKRRFFLLMQSKEVESCVSIPEDAVVYITRVVPLVIQGP